MKNPAETVRCPHCGAQPGAPCTLPATNRPLTLSSAHPSRCQDAGQPPDTTAVQRAKEAE